MNTKRSIPTLVLQNQWPHLYIPMEAILPEIEKDEMFNLLSDHSENHIERSKKCLSNYICNTPKIIKTSKFLEINRDLKRELARL